MIDQTPDEPTGMLCKACGHDMSDHKTSANALGYPCTAWGKLPNQFQPGPCPCPFFQG